MSQSERHDRDKKAATSQRERSVEELARELEQEKAMRRKAEEGLREAQALYHSLVDQMPAGVFRKDAEGRFVFVNSWFCRLKGMSEAKFLNKTSREVAAEILAQPDVKDRDIARETKLSTEGAGHHETIIKTGRRIEVEEEYRGQDGNPLYLHVTKTPVFDAAGKVIGSQAIQFDVTQHKLAEAKLLAVHRQLLEASRQAGMAEVATNVLHNVGNVLNSVNISASLLSQRLRQSRIEYVAKAATLLSQPPQQLARFLTEDSKGKSLPGYLGQLAEALTQEKSDMENEVDSLVKNIEHIKNIVAMQQSLAKPGGVVEEVEPKELVEDAVQINVAALERYGIRLIRDYQPAPRIMVDRHKVLQILVNLVSNAGNALDNTVSDKTLVLSVSAPDPEHVRIQVRDNGAGIAAENLCRVFSQGFTTRKNGHGFGLHSGANAAKELGGSLWAESGGLGKGATFTLELPRNGGASAGPG